MSDRPAHARQLLPLHTHRHDWQAVVTRCHPVLSGQVLTGYCYPANSLFVPRKLSPLTGHT